jgi:hypothetical protein
MDVSEHAAKDIFAWTARCKNIRVNGVANMPRYGLLFAGSYSYSAGQAPQGYGVRLTG